MDDQRFAALRTVLDETQFIEFTVLVGYYLMLATVMNSCALEDDSPSS